LIIFICFNLLLLSRQALLRVMIFFSLALMYLRTVELAHNGLRLGEEADFEALNCLPPVNLIRSTKLHLSTETAFLPNAC